MSPGVLGVGIIGAGPVTQAIHLPTLARLADLFRITTVMDVSPDIAASVAGRVGARPTTDVEDLLADPGVDVVVICSPHQFHAEQVIAACRAGKKAVLCEKPFATTTAQAQEIAAVSAQTGVPILVGAMHTFDPGWLAAQANWGTLGSDAHFIRSSVVLPPNPRFEDFATEVITRPSQDQPDFTNPEVLAGLISAGVMGLAIHDLPLVRTFLPDWEMFEVLSAHVRRPFGYSIIGRAGDRIVELHALMSANWAPNWVVEAISEDRAVRVAFTPSYVQAGGAGATVSTADTAVSHGPFDYNGYEGEWRELAAVAHGRPPRTSTDTLIDDLTFALKIAELASDRARTAATAAAA